MFKKHLQLVLFLGIIGSVILGFPQEVFAKAPGAAPIDTINIYNGGIYNTPIPLQLAWTYIPNNVDCLWDMYFVIWVDGSSSIMYHESFADRYASNPSGACIRSSGSFSYPLSLTAGAHSVAVSVITSGFIGGMSLVKWTTWNYSNMNITVRPPVPAVTMLLNGLPWNIGVPADSTPFTLQITGTNNPTQCFMQTTNAQSQTTGYQSFPCDRYRTPQTVRPSDFDFKDGDNFIQVYMTNAVGFSNTVTNSVSINSIPEVTVLLNGKPSDISVSTVGSPFRLQITGTNNPTHCYMRANGNDSEFSCDRYATEQTVLPSDFGFVDGWNNMEVWMENSNGRSESVNRVINIRPIPEVTMLLNGASQDIRVPLTSSPFTLQITGTNNPQQCYMKAVNSSGQGDFYQWFPCDRYENPQTVIPSDWPFFFQNGTNTIRVYMTNSYGDSSEEVMHTVTIGTFRPSVNFLLNGLPQDLVLATPTSLFDILVSFIDNPTACFESRKAPLAPGWGPYVRLPDQSCLVEGGLALSGVSPGSFGLQVGVNGIRYYVSNSAGNSDVVERYITVPAPMTNTLSLCTESGLTSIATGGDIISRSNLTVNASENLRAFYDDTPGDCAGTDVTRDTGTTWTEDPSNPAVSISANGSFEKVTAGNISNVGEQVTLTHGADTIRINYSIPYVCTPNCSNAPNVCTGTSFDDSNACGTNNCTGTRNCNYNWKEVSP